MKKIVIIFALMALATFAFARKHRYYDGYYGSNSNYGGYNSYSDNNSSYNSSSNDSYGDNSSNYSYGDNGSNNSYEYNSSGNYGSDSNSSSNPFESFPGLGSGEFNSENLLEHANDARNNATILQGHIDLFSGLVSMILSSAEHQDLIRNYTRRIRNIVALIDVSAVRNLVAGLVSEAFDSLRSLRNTLHSELVKLNNSADPTNELDLIIHSMEFAAKEEFHGLKGYLIDSLYNITQIHKERLSQADEETIADVKSLFHELFSYLTREYIVSSRGLRDVRRVLNLQRVRNTTAERRRLENGVRIQVRRLIRELEGLNIDRLESITNSAISLTFDKLQQLQQRVLDVSRRALDHHQPGSVLAEELAQFREGLGQSLVDFHKNLESDLVRLIRDLLRSSRFRGFFGTSIEVLVDSITTRVSECVDSIQDLFYRIEMYNQERQINDLFGSTSSSDSPCGSGRFLCENRRCVSLSAVCDQSDDCYDRSDENQFYMTRSRQTQNLNRCIQYQNSSSSSPFSSSPTTSNSSCRSGQFECRNGRCINENYVCDRDNDCSDNSDEDPAYFNQRPSSAYSKSCPGYAVAAVTPSKCPSGQFECRNGKCINASWVCDRDNDCGDSSDEDRSYFSLRPSSSYKDRCT